MDKKGLGIKPQPLVVLIPLFDIVLLVDRK